MQGIAAIQMGLIKPNPFTCFPPTTTKRMQKDLQPIFRSPSAWMFFDPATCLTGLKSKSFSLSPPTIPRPFGNTSIHEIRSSSTSHWFAHFSFNPFGRCAPPQSSEGVVLGLISLPLPLPFQSLPSLKTNKHAKQLFFFHEPRRHPSRRPSQSSESPGHHGS